MVLLVQAHLALVTGRLAQSLVGGREQEVRDFVLGIQANGLVKVGGRLAGSPEVKQSTRQADLGLLEARLKLNCLPEVLERLVKLASSAVNFADLVFRVSALRSDSQFLLKFTQSFIDQLGILGSPEERFTDT